MQGRVYAAIDPQLRRRVAIKLLTPRDPDSGMATQLTAEDVLAEGQAVARLRHPGIVSVYEAGMHRGRPFFVFEYIEGDTLRTLLALRGALPREEALPLFRGIADAMAYAHREEVVHLDLNPGNIMIDEDGHPRIMDFGLSVLGGRNRLSEELVVGTPRYMSPEHFARAPLGTGSDIFALGLMLYEMLTGVRAVQGNTPDQIMAQMMSGEFDFDLLAEHDVDGPLAVCIRSALRVKPSTRLPRAEGFVELIDGLSRHAELSRAVNDDDPSGTVQFLLRRMERTGDFPALSNNLVELNRLTGDDTASADRIAAVILRDYAMSHKLLKLANSAYYGRGGEITKISEAVVRLGVAQVRLACCSLSYLNHFGDSKAAAALRERIVESFMCGLIARHLAARRWRHLAEEAFLCGMFRHLGRLLTIFYFPEDHDFAQKRITEDGVPEREAYAEAIGTTAPVLGAAIARIWKFPDTIVYAMSDIEDGIARPPAGDGDALLLCAALAERLAGIGAGPVEPAPLALLPGEFPGYADLDADFLLELLRAAVEKCGQIAPVLDLPWKSAACTANYLQWAGATAETVTEQA